MPYILKMSRKLIFPDIGYMATALISFPRCRVGTNMGKDDNTKALEIFKRKK